MSYKIVRVLTCDAPGCEAPSPYVLQGEDDQARRDGWAEYRNGPLLPPLHLCPACRAGGGEKAIPPGYAPAG